MTPEMQAAVAWLRSLMSALVETGEAESAEDAQALALVLAAVTPREGAEALVGTPYRTGGMFAVCVDPCITPWSIRVHANTREDALRIARAVAQVAAREAPHA